MIKYLFDNLEDVKPHINVPNTLELESLNAAFKFAGEDHISPTISEALWGQLLEKYNTDQESITNTEAALIHKIRPALIRFALYQYYQENQAEWTGAGWAVRTEGGTFSPADFRDVNRALAFLRNQAFLNLEKLQSWIEEYKADFTTYATSNERAFKHRFFINNSRAFSIAYTISPYTFSKLQAQLEEVETFFILPTIGEAFFNALKQRQLTGLNESDLLPLHYIRKVLSVMVVKEAITANLVQLSGSDVVLITDNGSYRQKKYANNQEANPTLEKLDLTAKRWLSKLTDTLQQSPDIYTDYHQFIQDKNDSTGEEYRHITNTADSGNFVV